MCLGKVPCDLLHETFDAFEKLQVQLHKLR
jgi:hypothetical protein